jgi:hypothetical protein
MPGPPLIAKNVHAELALLPSLANRHGLITGERRSPSSR